MQVLLESYIFYVDLYFVQNLIMKGFALYLTFLHMKQYHVISHIRGVIKVILVAFLGTTLEVIVLLLIRPYVLFLILVYILIMPFSIRLLLPKEDKNLLVYSVCYIFYTLILNGVVECLGNYWEESQTFIEIVLISGSSVLIMYKIWSQYHKNQKGVYQIKIKHKGKEIFSQGYYDSGNCLKDCYSQKSVHIISKDLLEQVITGDEASVYLPFQSLGKVDGLIKVIYIDEMLIYAEKVIKLEKVPVGIADDNLFQEKSYKVILNEGVL